MKSLALIACFIVLVSTVVLSFACSLDNADSEGTATEMEQFMAQSIIDEEIIKAGVKPANAEGSIIAHVVTMEGRNELLSPIRVWKYNQGKLVAANESEFHKAVSNNRSDWPPYTFAFTFQSKIGKQEGVLIRTLYNTSAIENGRGGNEQSWELNKMTSGFTIGDKNIQMSWK